MSGGDNFWDVEHGWTEYGEPPDGRYDGGGGSSDDERDEDQEHGEDFGNGPEWVIARTGSTLSGGGTIVGGSEDVEVGGVEVARAGDLGYCSSHRRTVVIQESTCSQRVYCNGKKVALQGWTYVDCGHLIMGIGGGGEYAGN